MASVPIPVSDPAPDPKVEFFHRLKQEFGMYSPGEYCKLVRKLPATAALVEGLLPAASVNILVGDSGIGKSPLAYQLALSVAAGVPFLGMSTRPAKVLLMDYENSAEDSQWILEQQRKHLGLAKFPDASLVVWPVENSPARRELLPQHVEEMLRTMRPDLAIIDSLRFFSPRMEGDNKAATQQLKKLRGIATQFGITILFVHHVRKQNRQTSLEDCLVLEWLVRSAGARALINHTDVRIAVAARKDGVLVLRGHVRTRGEVGPLLISRVWDDAGEPRGYQRKSATPADLVNPEQEAALARLAESFSFTDAMKAYGRKHEATNLFLHKLIRLGLIGKTGRGEYRKSKMVPETGSTELTTV